MSGWMIGLGLTGAFMGAACGWLGELTKDWNGGSTKPGALGRFFKAAAIGAGLGIGAGWLMTDSKSKDEAAIEACYKQAPAQGTVNITRTAEGVKCSYTR
jgi:hypothetical protein